LNQLGQIKKKTYLYLCALFKKKIPDEQCGINIHVYMQLDLFYNS
jgi:hypothetical protein